MYKSYVFMLALASIACGLTACTTEQNYRGVPAPAWQQLTPEQKQLIVDRSFQDEMQ